MKHDAKDTQTGRNGDTIGLTLDGQPLTLETLDSLAQHRLHVELSDEVWRRIETSADAVRRIASGSEAAYGINTGFGHLCTTRIAADQLQQLQTNLILSHAVGVGDPVPPDIVRWMMLFKVHALTHGVSGISRTTLQCLLDLINADVLPVVPSQGSLGASGDLAPLAHMVLPMIGHGEVWVEGKPQPTATVLSRKDLSAIELGAKEGLALINGTQLMAAYGATVAVRARRLVKHADIIFTMSLEGLRGSVHPFDERLHDLRPHAGAINVARNVRQLMAGSQIVESHKDCAKVQDPYSLRCAAQVHGASRDALRHAAETIETELNAVTDNPLIFENDEVISGGAFHGQPLALVLDYLAIALAELGSISERRIYLLLSGHDELPPFLIENAGVNSGLMVVQFTAAALVSENKGLCMPASVDTIPTSLGQEDHVSMGARSAVKCLKVLENTETVLAIEQFCAAQALDYRAPLLPGRGPRVAHEEMRKIIGHADHDRQFSKDIESSLALLRSHSVVAAVESDLGPLR